MITRLWNWLPQTIPNGDPEAGQPTFNRLLGTVRALNTFLNDPTRDFAITADSSVQNRICPKDNGNFIPGVLAATRATEELLEGELDLTGFILICPGAFDTSITGNINSPANDLVTSDICAQEEETVRPAIDAGLHPFQALRGARGRQ